MTGYTDYFGYIFRVIDKQGRNIDLIYDKRFLENKHLKLIIDEKVSNIAFDIKINKLFKQWYNIKLRFDLDKQELVLSADGKVYREKIKLKADCYQIFFGATDFKEHEVRDVPPMKLKDIKITDDDRLLYHWPLNEHYGENPSEVIEKKSADVDNPVWIRRLHHDWKLMQEISITGPASVAFDAVQERLFVVTERSLYIHNLNTHKTEIVQYSGGPRPLLPGNRSYYDINSGGLINFYTDQKMVSVFNFISKNWDKRIKTPDVPTNYWHPNYFYSKMDSTLYIIGGYGQYMYKKDVQSYNFKAKTWERPDVKGEFTPRYLAALGASQGGAYILGGYGSSTGQQILNPKNIYDLTYFDVKKRTFKKLYDFVPKEDEFAFANSMIIDEKDKSYYALTFANHVYNSSLRLIKGSLTSPKFEFVGNKIPYTFHDINSFADLYYSPADKKLVSALLFYDPAENRTSVKIYSLQVPAEAYLSSAESQSALIKSKWYLLFSLVPLLVLAFIFYRKKFKNNKTKQLGTTPAISRLIEENEELNEEQTVQQEAEDIRNTIFLFGNMQLFDNQGKDITKQFTPVIKELFLLILLFTIRWERGISSEKLEELLWFDKPIDSARNNRSVNIAKVKTLIEGLGECYISKDTGYWKIKIDHSKLRIDYTDYQNIMMGKKKISKQNLHDLTAIISRGSFLSNTEYSWADTLKSEISNEIIDTCLRTAAGINIADDPEFLISIANCVLNCDPVNEDAIAIKCKTLVFLGKHSIAKSIFENFNKEYKSIYDQSFNKTFQELLG
ncbi:galactose oxidase [Pedobacter miscanthi]|nr:galactose oxidase [Pedobacter miscanthi]